MSRIDDKETLLDLERTRASALVGGDIDTLRSFIPEDLMHVHATGAIDNYDAYFNLLENDLKFRRIERGKLRIDISGETAVMTGPQQIEFEWVRTGVARNSRCARDSNLAQTGGPLAADHIPSDCRNLNLDERGFDQPWRCKSCLEATAHGDCGLVLDLLQSETRTNIGDPLDLGQILDNKALKGLNVRN